MSVWVQLMPTPRPVMGTTFIVGCTSLASVHCLPFGAKALGPLGVLRRIHCVDTWVASELDVSTKKDDHFPTVAELLWQPLPLCCPVSWHTPLISRASLKDEASSAYFRHWLSLVPVPPVSTPVEAHHAYVVSVLQEAGALFFPVQREEATTKGDSGEHLANYVIGTGLA